MFVLKTILFSQECKENREPTSGLEPLAPAHYECAVRGCQALHGLTNPASRWRTSVNASQAMPLKLAVFLSAPFFMLLAVVAMFCPPVTSLPNSTANTSFAISGHEGK